MSNLTAAILYFTSHVILECYFKDFLAVLVGYEDCITPYIECRTNTLLMSFTVMRDACFRYCENKNKM